MDPIYDTESLSEAPYSFEPVCYADRVERLIEEEKQTLDYLS